MKSIWLFFFSLIVLNAAAQNVGIGLTTPLAKLHLKSDFEIMRLQGQNHYLSFYDNAGIYKGYLWNRNNNSIDLGTPSGSGLPITISPNTITSASFTSNGFVGIGVKNPLYIMDINGRMRLRYAGETPGIWFNNQANNATPGFVGMLDDNNVGFYGSGAGWPFLMDVNNGHVGMGGSPDFNIRTYIRGDNIALYAGGTSTSSTAFTLGTGKLAVESAGINTNTSVFVHKAVASNTPVDRGYTVIDNVYCNNNPSAILIVTMNATYGSGNAPGYEMVNEYGCCGTVQVISPISFLVFYNGINSGLYAASPAYAHNRWCIRTYVGNSVAIPDGFNFNVMVVNPG
jgi:hypothetical protein